MKPFDRHQISDYLWSFGDYTIISLNVRDFAMVLLFNFYMINHKTIAKQMVHCNRLSKTDRKSQTQMKVKYLYFSLAKI